MAVFPVVLDSCVLYKASLRDSLLRLAAAGLYRVHWSQEILDGATRNLVKNKKMDEVKAARLQDLISEKFPEALVEVPPDLVKVMPNHPGDRHVMAVAVKAHAQVIVTNNLKHFPPEELDPWGVEAQSPDTFLTHLFSLEPDLVVLEVQKQAQALKNPPMTVNVLLQRCLQDDAPQFVGLVREHLT